MEACDDGMTGSAVCSTQCVTMCSGTGCADFCSVYPALPIVIAYGDVELSIYSQGFSGEFVGQSEPGIVDLLPMGAVLT